MKLPLIPDIRTPVIWMLASLLLAALAVAGVERTRRATVESKFATYKAAAADADAKAQAANRAEEQRRQAAQKKDREDAQKELAAARADASAAADAGRLLRNRIAALTRQARTASDTTAPAGSPPADATADLLADVQRRLGEATDRIAQFADAAHIAGKTCERDYHSLTP
jgi:hypothetical protein